MRLVLMFHAIFVARSAFSAARFAARRASLAAFRASLAAFRAVLRAILILACTHFLVVKCTSFKDDAMR